MTEQQKTEKNEKRSVEVAHFLMIVFVIFTVLGLVKAIDLPLFGVADSRPLRIPTDLKNPTIDLSGVTIAPPELKMGEKIVVTLPKSASKDTPSFHLRLIDDSSNLTNSVIAEAGASHYTAEFNTDYAGFFELIVVDKDGYSKPIPLTVEGVRVIANSKFVKGKNVSLQISYYSSAPRSKVELTAFNNLTQNSKVLGIGVTDKFMNPRGFCVDHH